MNSNNNNKRHYFSCAWRLCEIVGNEHPVIRLVHYKNDAKEQLSLRPKSPCGRQKEAQVLTLASSVNRACIFHRISSSYTKHNLLKIEPIPVETFSSGIGLVKPECLCVLGTAQHHLGRTYVNVELQVSRSQNTFILKRECNEQYHSQSLNELVCWSIPGHWSSFLA